VTACSQKYVREEAITAQVDRTIAKVTLEAAIADQMVAELEQERTVAASALTSSCLVASEDRSNKACRRKRPNSGEHGGCRFGQRKGQP